MKQLLHLAVLVVRVAFIVILSFDEDSTLQVREAVDNDFFSRRCSCTHMPNFHMFRMLQKEDQLRPERLKNDVHAL